jgi:hypothetical protein
MAASESGAFRYRLHHKEQSMKEADVKARAFAMPLTNPAYPPGPYRFVNREFMIITYRTDPDKLRAVVPEPLEVDEPLVKYEFIRMPDSTGFGDYTETGQVIPVRFRGRTGGYSHCMFLNDEPPIAGGRELWGFPKKLANPTLHVEIDQLVGTLDYGPVRVVTATMGYKHNAVDAAAIRAFVGSAEFSAQDHTARRRDPAHLRTGRILSRGRDSEGRLDRPRGDFAHAARARARRRAAGARSRLRRTSRLRPHARPRQSRLRLSPALDEARVSAQAGHGRSIVTCV